MINNHDIEILKSQISEKKNFAVITHYNPDGDALGSSLALYDFFTQLGKDITCIAPNHFPSYLDWLPNRNSLVIARDDYKKAVQIIEQADVLFVVDMNAPHRAGKELEETIKNTSAFKVLIDHHINPDIECDFTYSMIKTTSTCELVYRFFAEVLDMEAQISLSAAECIYTGIITDTGSLSYACNQVITYKILEKLIGKGVDGEMIHQNVYDNYSESRLRLLSVCLSHLTVMEQHATSYMKISQDEMKQNGFKDGDTEGFVNYGLALSTVKFTAFFIERPNRIRISFRSKGDFDVNQFARTHFQGGGHKNASATYHYDTLENTIAYFEEVVRNHPDLN